LRRREEPMQATKMPLVITGDEGEATWFGGVGAIFKLSAEHTRGAFSLIVQPVEPGRLVYPHVHWGEDEFSYVLEGTLGARIGDEEILAEAGSIILKPKGVPHTFWNPGSKPARFIELISPPGFEKFFVEFQDVFKTGEFNRMEGLGRKYNCSPVDGWADDLKARYNLKLLGE
jgi:mannose-6-phosphate isomerase-like protein (cupin superfamily)